ncbi:hypothetical protein J2T57_001500 [Natronocella acetinitrilica]|uniref:Uncharacterized protein n=1 Tax=Natronocella acetinitrilica TaxID=414046 RepID=A0AAE3G4S6_9GAMM|nr:hypothetical protein [Natronocella acetinitrilica]MCP1674398.1 hypothetical protein [Natronocella acetinitrilica]
MTDLTRIREHIERQGFGWEDCPYTPIRPEWESFPIVEAIRAAEAATGDVYERPAGAEYFTKLKPAVMKILEAYQEDFLRHDREGLEGFSGEFILGVRATGTNLLKLTEQLDVDARESMFEGGTGGMRVYDVVRSFVFDANQTFFHGKDGRVGEIPKAAALTRFERFVETSRARRKLAEREARAATRPSTSASAPTPSGR